MDLYTLEGKTPVPCEDTYTWGMWMEKADRSVGSKFIGDVHISTVFIGVNHRLTDDSPPILFETMIFGGKHDEFQQRYETWEMAEAGHKAAVELVERGK